MRSRRYVVLLWAMLLCVVIAAAGCKRSAKDEDVLVSIEETDYLSDAKEDADGQSADGTEDDKENTKEEIKESSGENPHTSPADMDENGIIYVDVCGQVKNPGVYQLTDGSRIYEALERAGGTTEDAAEALLNQAERLTDGQQIYVPSKEEQEAARESGTYPVSGDISAGAGAGNTGAEAAADGKVNLNTASKEELMTLTGIGEVKADSIIRYREEHGGFQSAEDVKKIEGIKDGVFNKIKDQITV